MAAVLILGMFAAMTWLSIVNPRAVFLITVFLAPWQGLDVDFGLRIIAYQLALMPLCLVTFIRSTQPGWRNGSRGVRVAGSGLLMALILYTVVLSLIQLGFIPFIKIDDSFLRTPMARAIIQIGLYFFALSPALLAPWLLRGIDDVRRAMRIYIASTIVLAIIGWVQIIVWYGTGKNPMPVGAVNIALGGGDFYNRDAIFSFASQVIYRMNSLAGEPRHLGVALVFSMLMIQVMALTARKVPGLRLFLMWFFMLVSALATLSTSAAAVWLAGSAAILPAIWLWRVPIQRSTLSIVAALAAVVVPFVVIIAAVEASGIPVIDILSERTIERIDANGAVEDFDLAIIDSLVAQPEYAITGVGLGNAHLYATPYLDPVFAEYAEGGIFSAKTGYLKLISESGFIGLFLFVGWYLRLMHLITAKVRRDPANAAAIPIAAVMMVIYMLTHQVQAEIWTAAGLLATIAGTRTRPVPATRPAPSGLVAA